MTSSASRASIAFTAATTFLLGGCGGGGGNGDSNTPSLDRNAAIKSANAKDVAANAYSVVDFLNRQITSSVTDVTDSASADLSDKRCKDHTPGGATREVDPTTNTVVINYNNCDDGVWIKNGKITIQVSGDPNGDRFQNQAWSGTLAITFGINFKLNSEWSALILMESTSSETGDLTVTYSQTAPNVGTYKASNSTLQWSLTTGSSTVVRNISMLDYIGSTEASNLNKIQTASFNLSGNLGRLGPVEYDVKTNTGFIREVSSEGFKNPSQGAMTIVAKDKSSLTLTAADATSVGLDLDWNGDNAIDEKISTTWNDLNSKLLFQF
ncbi:MAG TPA: hypothetical protein VJ575_03595 [Pseudogulbenkiania sp.]|nr:hypothetical protein [Pseudogulbenkiania sp.]